MERKYYGRLSRVVVDFYPTVYRDYLHKQLPPNQCQLAADRIRILRPNQLNVTRNVEKRGDYGECDMQLMYILASCGRGSLPSPKNGWGNLPITGTGIADDLERMMSIYRKIVDSLLNERISKQYYNDCIDMTRNICRRLDTKNARHVEKSKREKKSYETIFDDQQKKSMDDRKLNSYIKQIKQIKQNEKEVVTERMNFFRLSRIVADLYTTIYHELLTFQLRPAKCPKLDYFHERNVPIFPDEETQLERVRTDNSYRKCDISLMNKILSNANSSKRTADGSRRTLLESLPTDLVNDIKEISRTRNKALAHKSSTPLPQRDFDQYVKCAKQICTRMDDRHYEFLLKSFPGTYTEELNKILTESLDPICVEKLASGYDTVHPTPDLQDALEQIHRKTLERVPLNPLQKNTRIPFEAFSASLEIKEDQTFKERTFKSEREKKYKDVTSAKDFFEVDGKRAKNMYILGEPGRGKTGQCYQLLQHWVQAREAGRKNKELSEWQKGLTAYELVFFITLRHVHKGINSVFEMLCTNVLNEYPQFHFTIRHILKNGLGSAKCLILLDGLDEMRGEPVIDIDRSRCTIITTSRHWKFHCSPRDIGDRDKVLEVYGLSELGIEQVIQMVANYPIEEAKSSEDKSKIERTVRDIGERTKDQHLKPIMHIPLLLTLSVHLWLEETFTGGSITSFFALLANFLLKRAFNNGHITDAPPQRPNAKYVPPIIKRKGKLNTYLGAILSLGKLGYKDLVLGSQGESQNKQETTQLVFEKDDLEKELGEDLLTFALNVGLLSQSSAPGAGDEENVSINFFHKTIEEFLVALYLVCGDKKKKKGMIFDSFLKFCTSSKKILELSNILIFSVGLKPSIGSAVSEHIVKIADSDSDILKYREGQGFEYTCHTGRIVESIFMTLCDCYREIKCSPKQAKIPYYISDVCLPKFRRRTDESTAAIATELLSLCSNIVSLNIGYGAYGVSTCIPFEYIEKFLDSTQSLVAFYIKGDIDTVCFCSIGSIFSYLTVVSLDSISLTSAAAGAFKNAIQSNKNIKSLQLRYIRIRDSSSSFGHDGLDKKYSPVCEGKETSPSSSDGSEITSISFDMKKNEELRTLYLSSTGIMLEDITRCKLLVYIQLEGVKVKNVDMLQKALSSFAQLKDLLLSNLPFSIRYDLKNCTKLRALHLTSMRLESIEISPVSLQTLSLDEVSGSLKGLLSALPKCQNLTDLYISQSLFHFWSLSEQNVKVGDDYDRKMCLDLKASKRLTRMRLSNIHLRSIEINPVSLKYVEISHVSGSLQGLLSTFPECQNLTNLEMRSCYNEGKMCLDLTSCTHLEKLKLSEMRVDSVYVSPASLNCIVISHVFGSLRGLLSVLPECQHLTHLGIESLSDEQDVKLLMEKLPQTRQLESLSIQYMHREYLVLTLAPLMTHIRYVQLVSIGMNSSSWAEFVDSLLSIKHGFEIHLAHTNIDDKSVSAVNTSTDFKVTKDKKGERNGQDSFFSFSKLPSK